MPQTLDGMSKNNYNDVATEWQNDEFESKSEQIINKLKTDHKFCMDFFFGTKQKECNIARLRLKILNDLKTKYGIVMSVNDFNLIVYETVWADGTWAPLDTYEKRSTFHAWLRKVAKNAVMEYLIENHQLPNPPRTAGNTRLTLLSQPIEMCQMVLDDLMEGSPYYDVLHIIYVERLSKDEAAIKLGLTEDEFVEAKKKGERILKDVILRSTYYFEEDILHDKNARIVTVSSEFVADMAEWCMARTGVNPLRDVFGTNLSAEEIHKKTVDFLYDFSEKLGWKEEDRYVWRKRFVENASPVDLATELGRTRAWVDTRYSRLNKRFNTAIKKWWKNNAA